MVFANGFQYAKELLFKAYDTFFCSGAGRLSVLLVKILDRSRGLFFLQIRHMHERQIGLAQVIRRRLYYQCSSISLDLVDQLIIIAPARISCSSATVASPVLFLGRVQLLLALYPKLTPHDHRN